MRNSPDGNHEPCTRRELFANIANVTEAVLAGFIALGNEAHARLTRDRKPTLDDPCVDQTHPLPEGGSIRNIGAFHTREMYEKRKDFLHAAIDDCDVLLVEGDGLS